MRMGHRPYALGSTLFALGAGTIFLGIIIASGGFFETLAMMVGAVVGGAGLVLIANEAEDRRKRGEGGRMPPARD